MIWPFAPLDPMIEGLLFRTDRLRAFSTDQRIRLTDIPRRRFNHSYRWTGRQYEIARAMLRGQLPDPVMLPDWTAFSRVSAASGATSLIFDNTNPAIASDDSAIIIRRNAAGDTEQYEELDISGSSSGGLTLGTGLSAAYSNAIVAPLIECHATEGLNATRAVVPSRDAQIEWTGYSGDDIASVGSAPTYRTFPVLTECSRLGDSSIPAGLVHPYDVVDNGLAVPFFDTIQEQPVQQFGAAWQPQTRAEAYALRQWFHYLKGRQKAFWVPDMNRGLTLAANIANAAATISIVNVGFAAGYGSGDLFLKTTSGTVYTIQVASSVDAGATETLTLTSPAPAAITIAQVDKLSLMFCVILVSDRIEWLHRARVGPKVVCAVEEVPL